MARAGKVVRQMLSLMRAFLGSRSGSLAMVTAICAPALFAVVAAAADYVTMASLKARLQAAADAAALASVKELSLAGATQTQIKATAANFVRTNLQGREENGRSDALSVDVGIDGNKRTVDISLELTWTPFFLHFLSDQVTPVRAEARAQTVGPRLACVLGLAKLAPPGVQLWTDASLTADGCDVYSNTEAPLGLVVNDDATLKADLICVSGGYVAVSPGAVAPEPITDCPPFADPLAARAPPAVGPCDHIATVILNKNVTLDPGVYCGGLIVRGTSKVELNPGTYIIKNGLLQVGDSASLIGRNAGFYLAGIATLMLFDSGSTIDLTAPESGPLAGLLFFEDRAVPPLRVHRIGSNNARNLLGTIYLPLGTLLIDAIAPVADKSAYTAIVAQSLQLRKGPKLVLHSDYDSTDVPVPDGLITRSVFLIQ